MKKLLLGLGAISALGIAACKLIKIGNKEVGAEKVMYKKSNDKEGNRAYKTLSKAIDPDYNCGVVTVNELKEIKELIDELYDEIDYLDGVNAEQADNIRESIFSRKPCDPAYIHEMKSKGIIEELSNDNDMLLRTLGHIKRIVEENEGDVTDAIKEVYAAYDRGDYYRDSDEFEKGGDESCLAN